MSLSTSRARTALALLRIVLAVLLFVHPSHALAHVPYLRALADGLPVLGGLAFPFVVLAMVIRLMAATALLLPRAVRVAAIVNAVLIVAQVAMYQAPYWYVVGGGAVPGHPGAELSVLELVVLAAIVSARSDDRAPRAMAIVRMVAPLLLLAHASRPFLMWDVEGMRGWGEGMSEAGFPAGVALVWTVVTTQCLSSFFILARRFVAVACAGHIAILVAGILVEHAPLWFVVGPGTGGMEYSVLLIAVFASIGAVHWPSGASIASIAASPASDASGDAASTSPASTPSNQRGRRMSQDALPGPTQ